MSAFLAGAAAGLGLLLLVLAAFPARPTLARQLAAYERARQAAAAPASARSPRERLGAWLAERCAERGWRFPSLQADLALTGRSMQAHLAAKVLLGVGGLLLAPVLALASAAGGFPASGAAPAGLGLALACGFFILPDISVRRSAAGRRRDFRHALSAFLDLVAMNLAGGRGLPEALMAAGAVGGGPAFAAIASALASARITGHTPWQALAALGEEIGVDELRDLAAALGLVAEDGARVRQSLTARAAGLRQRELADLAGRAGERSQSMLVAQMLLCVGFLVFLVYPVVGLLLGG